MKKYTLIFLFVLILGNIYSAIAPFRPGALVSRPTSFAGYNPWARVSLCGQYMKEGLLGLGRFSRDLVIRPVVSCGKHPIAAPVVYTVCAVSAGWWIYKKFYKNKPDVFVSGSNPSTIAGLATAVMMKKTSHEEQMQCILDTRVRLYPFLTAFLAKEHSVLKTHFSNEDIFADKIATERPYDRPITIQHYLINMFLNKVALYLLLKNFLPNWNEQSVECIRRINNMKSLDFFISSDFAGSLVKLNTLFQDIFVFNQRDLFAIATFQEFLNEDLDSLGDSLDALTDSDLSVFFDKVFSERVLTNVSMRHIQEHFSPSLPDDAIGEE